VPIGRLDDTVASQAWATDVRDRIGADSTRPVRYASAAVVGRRLKRLGGASLKRSKDEIVYDTVYERNERFVRKRQMLAHLTHEASRCNHTITCRSLTFLVVYVAMG